VSLMQRNPNLHDKICMGTHLYFEESLWGKRNVPEYANL